MYDELYKLLPTVVMMLLIKVTHNIRLGNQNLVCVALWGMSDSIFFFFWQLNFYIFNTINSHLHLFDLSNYMNWLAECELLYFSFKP